MIKRWLLITTAVLLITSLLAGGAFAAETERTDGGYFTLVDEKGRVIDCTGLMVNVGDEYITPSNQRFKVARIEGNKAHCIYIGMEKMPALANETGVSTASHNLLAFLSKRRPLVAIYHTHNDESYVPSDGTDSKRGRGGIVDVGDVLRDKLRALGVNAVHDTTDHEPHDANAYYRSRRTVTRLLRSGPDLLVDVHRDTVPPQVYGTKVKGTPVTKVKLVVGRQNANLKSNLKFAKRVKAQMDKMAPGLSAGIFMGKGNYNQDLTPRAILAEVGADTNSKDAAERGISMFARSLTPILGVETAPARKPLETRPGGQPATDWTTVLWVLVGAGAIYAGYVFLNRGRIK